MEIQLKNRDDKEQRHFITDIPNIFHFTNVLESALNETKTSHIRRGPTSNWSTQISFACFKKCIDLKEIACLI